VRAPCAAVPAEAALEERDDALDAGAEVTQLPVEPRALDHLLDGDTRRFAEYDVADTERLDFAEVVARAEAAVEHDLLWLGAEHLDRASGELDRLVLVDWIAALDHTVDDQARSASGEKDLVAVQRVAPVLPDDVGVRLEDRDDLLRCGHGFSFEHAAPGLIEHLVC